MIEGGETLEYDAHLVPEMGFKGIPTSYKEGFLLVADVFNKLFHINGDVPPSIFKSVMAAVKENIKFKTLGKCMLP